LSPYLAAWILVDMNSNDSLPDTGQGPSADAGTDAHAEAHAEVDVAVIGGGAAGLSAALVLTRARREVVLIDAGQPRNAPAAHMQGFLSRDGMPPAELLAAGRDEVTSYGGRILADTVTSLGSGAGDQLPLFEVETAGGEHLTARRILVTTGLRDDIPDIPGVRERWGRDLLHCPYCHGYEVRDQPLGVLGGNTESVAHALLIRQWTDDVVLFANGDTVSGDQRERLVASAVGIVDEPVTRLVTDDDQLTGVELADGAVVPRAAVFVRPRFVPNDALLTELGCAVSDQGWVVVDPTGQTTVPGVWAAGNAVNPRAQVITAAGEGSAAAIAVNNDLVDEDARLAVDRYRAGLPA
jgi:thioredoxin reductase